MFETKWTSSLFFGLEKGSLVFERKSFQITSLLSLSFRRFEYLTLGSEEGYLLLTYSSDGEKMLRCFLNQ